MDAKHIFKSRYFDVVICPTWHPGWQTWREYNIPNMRLGLMFIPGFMFVIKWHVK